MRSNTSNTGASRAQVSVVGALRRDDESHLAKSGREYRDSKDVGGRSIAADTIELDLPAVAAALSQRLHAAGLPVTPDRAVRFAQALSLVGPVSGRQLYCTARAVFVSAHAEQPTFDRAFASVFSCAHESLKQHVDGFAEAR
jgi:uncharacterized protein with von Willebrand factor type A (vWA) domain